MRALLAVLPVLALGCGGGPCPAGREATGLLGACCLPGQSATFGTCSGAPTACPQGWTLGEDGCTRDPLPPFRLVRVPAGSFTMGCLPEREGPDLACADNPPHEVTLTRPYAVMATEVTQALYEALVGENPSRLACAECPVHNVSWLDAVRFANALSAWEGLRPAYVVDGEAVTWVREADGYRLPTEAEWEHAARAGEEAPFAGGDDLDAVAVHEGNQRGGPGPVASRRPNTWGLYDMSGNVWEWTWSGRHDYPAEATVDPVGDDAAAERVVRGGAWAGIAAGVYLSYRGWIPREFEDVVLGFRLVRDSGAGSGSGSGEIEPAGAWRPSG